MRTSARIIALTSLSLLAFAANSILTRSAFSATRIDPVTFSTLRLGSGALVLTLLAHLSKRREAQTEASTRSVVGAVLLFAYALPFAIAYQSLDTGTGALLLFFAVQATMLLAAILKGERPRPLARFGLLLSGAGLVYLVSPGVSAPDVGGSILMLIAGVSWGAYSLVGRASKNPLQQTGENFLRSVPLALLASALFFYWGERGSTHWTREGATLALASGALASGLGYTVWYAALAGLTRTQAASLQLSVPVIAAFGGLLFLGEPFSARLIIASLMILGGLALVLRERPKQL